MEERLQRRIRNKNREMKRICVLVAVILWLISIGTIAMAAQAKKTIYYESVRVSYGDTLWDIAKKYKEEKENTEHMVRKIKELNGMITDNICSGERILIPIVKEAAR